MWPPPCSSHLLSGPSKVQPFAALSCMAKLTSFPLKAGENTPKLLSGESGKISGDLSPASVFKNVGEKSVCFP